MTDEGDRQAIRFYFSFRSPYAWLATERLESELGDLGVAIERLPIYPTPELAPETLSRTAMPNKPIEPDAKRMRGSTAKAFGLDA